MHRTPLWQTVLAFLLLPLAIPAAAVASLFSKPVQLEPEEVAKYLSDFIDGTGGPYDWDDFTSLKIADPALEAIRMKATEVDLPTNPESEATLRELLIEAQTLQRKST